LNQNFVANPVLKGIIYGLLSRICGLIPAQEVIPACDKGPFPSRYKCGIVGSSGHYSNLVVEALDRAGGNLALNLYSEIPKTITAQTSLLRCDPASSKGPIKGDVKRYSSPPREGAGADDLTFPRNGGLEAASAKRDHWHFQPPLWLSRLERCITLNTTGKLRHNRGSN